MASFESSQGAKRGEGHLLRLRLRQRREGDEGSNSRSLFARLTPSVVNSLYEDALQQIISSSRTTTNNNNQEIPIVTNDVVGEGGGWKISSTTTTTDFLPLEVQLLVASKNQNKTNAAACAATAKTVYVSYNGGMAAISCDDEDENILELPECMIIPKVSSAEAAEQQNSTTSQGGEHLQVARVTALTSIPDADLLFVEPLTIEDWELLETCAEFVENALLQQVSVVYSDQVLPLWVGGNDTAWIRILPKNFEQQQQQQPTSSSSSVAGAAYYWPSIEEVNSSSSSNKNNNRSNNSIKIKCLRLMQNTRVDVSPKPRPNHSNASTRPCLLRVLPTLQDYSDPMNQLAEEAMGRGGRNQTLPMTTPGTIWVNPATKRYILPGVMDTSSEDEEEDDDDDETSTTRTALLAVVWNAAFGSAFADQDDDTLPRRSCLLQIAFSNHVPERHIAIHCLTRSRLGVLPLMDNVFLRLLSPIEVARGSSNLINQQGHHKRGEISLRRVEIYENRTASKWRYPRELTHKSNSGGQCSSLYQNNYEPVEHGSFLFTAANPQGNQHALYQASFFEEHEESNSNNNSSSSSSISAADRCFLLRNKLQQIGINPHDKKLSTPPLIPTSIGTNVRYELPSQSLLLNLLGYDSIIPAELEAIKEQKLMMDAIVHGASGSGKSHTALVLAAFARFQSNNAPTFYLDCKRLKQGRSIRMKDILAELDHAFHDASTVTCGGDSVLILDDLDELSPNLEQNSGAEDSAQSHQVNPVAVDQAKLIGDYILRHLEVDGNPNTSVSVIITCRDRHSLLPSILCGRPFSRVVETPNLTASERERMLWNMIVSGSVSDNNFNDAFKSCRIGQKTDTFRPRDLQLLASKIRHTLRSTGASLSPNLIAHCAKMELETFVPLRQLSASEETSLAADWSDIGGLFHIKEVLTSTILNPAKYSRIYENARMRLPRGFLLFGSPGNGKSLLVPALAKKCGFSLVTCRGPELLDRYIGASESKVRELFARAASLSPSILFFDEIESLAPRRGSDNSGVTDRVVNQLLTLLDGVEDSNAKGLVYVIAATSRPDIVDPALLRPGRLEKHVFVATPEGDDEYTDMLTKIASRYSIHDELKEFISSGLFASEAKKISPNFDRLSCADFKAVFDTAQLGAIHQLLDKGQTNENVTIGIHHITEALRSTRPSLTERDHSMLMEVYRPFRKSLADGSSSARKAGQGKLRTALR